MNLFGTTGGLAYHYKAWRYRQQLWDSHRQGTSAWLKSWQPHSRHLVLIGPSAGYSLPRAFLEQFDRLTATDPDILSSRLFQVRFKGLTVNWARQNYFSQKQGLLWPEGLFHLREEHPDAAFLFCNFLGQLPLLSRHFDSQRESWLKHWQIFQQNSEWASFHDLWSTDQGLPPASLWANASPDLAASARHFVPADFKGTVRDHMTRDLFRDSCPRAQWLWHLTPNQTHCIEGVRPSKQDMGI
ncbi:MAG: hypothetical protein AB7N80_08720 [Bdellovibrionales bacterium]